MKIISYTTHHLVKSEDLNHHGTLFAGRSAEWFVESAFIAASTLLKPKNILCRKIHGLSFMRPVYPGSTVCLRSRVVYAGKSSMIVYVDFFLINDFENLIADGYVTFVNVDENAKSIPHGITLDISNDEERMLSQTAAGFKKE